MPNWCINTLAVHGPQVDVSKFKAQAIGYSPWADIRDGEINALNFNSLVPIPADVIMAGYGQGCEDWERDNWGCKWGACDSRIMSVGQLQYTFDTAWSPPVSFLSRLAPQWPTLTFTLGYEEPGFRFKGTAKAKGDAIEDHCVEY